jgi:hypothetical protein
MLLDFLDDVFLLHLALETAQCIFQRLTFLDNDFSHFLHSPPIRFGLATCGVTAWFDTAPSSLSHGNRRAVTYTAPGILLKSSHRAFYKTEPNGRLIDLRTITLSGVTLMR